MKLLLTSGGITNSSIHEALVDLLGKPVEESNALIIPTAIYPFAEGPGGSYQMISGKTRSPFTQLGWKSLGVLELSVLPSIQKENWVQAIQTTDALLVWGGDPLFLSYWLRESGLADILPSLEKVVYVGVSAGSMAVSGIFGETYSNVPITSAQPLTTQSIQFDTFEKTFITAHGAGLINFAIIPHFNNENHTDASVVNAAIWASMLPVPVYAIDDHSAVKVTDNTVEIVSEGHWKLFNQAT